MKIYSYCYEIGHSEQVKFVNHKYDMISDLQKRLFTSILQNTYFDKLYKLQECDRVIFKIKTFKNLKEVMEPFLNIKKFKGPRKVMESFYGIKNFETVMLSFLRIKNFKSRKKATESFFQY